MKIVEQKVEMLPLQAFQTLGDAYKRIEEAARTCYKSEDKADENSHVKMFDNLVVAKHYAMLEHGTVYLKVPKRKIRRALTERYMNNPYSKIFGVVGGGYIIVTNMRVIFENCWQDDLVKYGYFIDSFEQKKLIRDGIDVRVSFKITTSLQVAMQLIRHRCFSFAMESTRYCNYFKSKFGKSLTFIKFDFGKKWLNFLFKGYLKTVEWLYLYFVDVLKSPQMAAKILPKQLKTELVMTGSISDWKTFVEKRALEVTGKVLPDTKEIGVMVQKELELFSKIHS